jgi:hypothetical protein
MTGPLRAIQRMMARGDYIVPVHFLDAMRDDSLFWPDILAAIDGATEAVEAGSDAQGDPKYRLAGRALDGRKIEVVCVIKGPIVLVTVYTIPRGRP